MRNKRVVAAVGGAGGAGSGAKEKKNHLFMYNTMKKSLITHLLSDNLLNYVSLITLVSEL